MEKNDLIKKIEEISSLKIEISPHKEKLKNELLERYFQEKKKWEIFIIFKRFTFVTLNITVLVLVFSYLILPQYSLAKAEKIILADSEVRALIEKENVLKETKVIKNKGYVLISPAKEGELLKINQEEFVGILVEVNLKEKKISKIEKISPQIFLDKKEEERVKEIIQENPEIKKSIPEEAKISEIKNIPSRLKLIKKGEEIEISPKEKKATVIYKLNEKKWEGEVNLIDKKVEKIDFSVEEEKTPATIEKKDGISTSSIEEIKHPTTTGQDNLKNKNEIIPF